MKKTLFTLSAMVVMLGSMSVSAQTQEPQQRMAKLPACVGLNSAQVAAQVKRDFLQNRIVRWDNDKKILGTDAPVVWVSPDDIMGKDDIWEVPLTVRGTKASKNYDVMLNCVEGTISYSQPQ
ncbi:hypothetical protein NE897_01705 [Yersinia ruckeri]|uniref:Putative membrane protein n=1 Tax=Yersinia ruckeri TaxID=29486 RepID=A0A085U679_YERRU|nr:protein YebF [Yersinia ruckeri]AKA37460.1 hypothetical protein UGYR_02985 [Yersinia ruckeri]ARZ00746.1 Colicin-M immunity protein [Yersinia ruckeri]AUQ42918.1 hypothetical protein NJ56_14000 [Yersinia ruckeri]EEP98364.1 hypothetical protein yruck0001_12360 [Yersinia ruckeri ATCC 29473]EKN3361034.1 hypothetical protein [Yersinia ruckeri]